jgi:galactokinase
MELLIEEALKDFKRVFGKRNIYYWGLAPGRVNLIGEHTDYHNGYVLPFAISLYTTAILSSNDTKIVNIYSKEYNESHSFSLKENFSKTGKWTDRIEGLLRDILKSSRELKGFDIYIGGDLPIGKGLSSSASSMAAVGSVAAQFYNINFDEIDFAYALQKAEHVYGGVKCGLMDQLAILLSQEDRALFIDCSNLKTKSVIIPYNCSIILIDSNVKHELANSEYNKRQSECKKFIEFAKEINPAATSLRDVCCLDIAKVLTKIDEKLYKRVIHVLGENERVLSMVKALENGDLNRIASNLITSHLSLKFNYEVSVPELDYLVEQATLIKGVIGSRMTGGGFGGCTINIVERDSSKNFIEEMNDKYQTYFNKKAWIKEVCPVEGLTNGVYENEND